MLHKAELKTGAYITSFVTGAIGTCLIGDLVSRVGPSQLPLMKRKSSNYNWTVVYTSQTKRSDRIQDMDTHVASGLVMNHVQETGRGVIIPLRGEHDLCNSEAIRRL